MKKIIIILLTFLLLCGCGTLKNEETEEIRENPKYNSNKETYIQVYDARLIKEESLKDQVTVESNVDFKKPGTYNVHYYVTDSNNFRGHSVMTVVVEE